ncbi:MAG TPA: CAP domain-containing protein [Bacillales bacterium]|nr:CAP domain-containing protein [Bacillales bacterium]
MGYKKTKLAIASTLIIALGACATKNVDEGSRNDLSQPRNVSTGDLKHPMRNLNVSNINSTAEIQPMNNGFITIDQNSYSTSMGSHQFPHSKRIQQGNSWYYTFQPEIIKPGSRITQQPRNGEGTFTPAPNQATPAPAPAQPSPQPTTGINKVAMQVIDLTNAERKKNGLPPLKADASLSKVAQTKSNDMESKHYFSHTSPTYGSPFDMMRDFGVTYRTAGENIAMGQPTAQQVVNAWMNSEGHRKNILSPNYTNIGVGFTQTGNYWSQMFIGK